MSGTSSNRTVVLVVEDEPLLRIDAVDMVEDAGYEAVQAGNSAQAIKALEERDDIRIIMSDIHMPPGMDGISFVSLARERWPDIHIVLVSGNVDRANVRLPQGGIFFSKPYRQSDLVRALDRLAA
jgi:CheY-like chemotaxis protein